MKLEKKHWIIIGVVVAIIIVWYFFFRKKTTKAESGYSAGDIGGAFESGFAATNKAVRRFPLMPPLPNGYVIPASKVKKGAGCWSGYSQGSPDPVTGDVTCSKMKTD